MDSGGAPAPSHCTEAIPRALAARVVGGFSRVPLSRQPPLKHPARPSASWVFAASHGSPAALLHRLLRQKWRCWVHMCICRRAIS
jgi:hypothetical protein